MKDKIVPIGGMVTALLASACCIGPALFLAFGITGLGFLSMFEWLRPYLLVLTFIFVGIAYRSAYGKGFCNPDSACSLSIRKISRILLWVLVGFAAFGISFPYVAAWLLT